MWEEQESLSEGNLWLNAVLKLQSESEAKIGVELYHL